MASRWVGKNGRYYNRNGVDTFGEEIVHHVDVICERYTEYVDRESYLRNLLHQPGTGWRDVKFMYLHFVPFCKERANEQVPGEFAATIFDFRKGVIECRGGLIDPNYAVFTESGTTKQACLENKLPYPGTTHAFEGKYEVFEPAAVYTMLKDLADQYNLKKESDILIFGTRNQTAKIRECLNWLGRKSDVKLTFTILYMELLLRVVSEIYGDPMEHDYLIKADGGSAFFLLNPRYDHVVELGCDWHRELDNEGWISKCARNMSQRVVYNALLYFCDLFETTSDGNFKPVVAAAAGDRTVSRR